MRGLERRLRKIERARGIGKLSPRETLLFIQTRPDGTRVEPDGSIVTADRIARARLRIFGGPPTAEQTAEDIASGKVELRLERVEPKEEADLDQVAAPPMIASGPKEKADLPGIVVDRIPRRAPSRGPFLRPGGKR